MTTGPQDLRGQLLGGRYRVGRVLGRGGMGTVYEAVQESLGRAVAVKVLHPALSPDAEAVTRFRKEAEQAGALSHPHIVHVLDFGYEDGGLAWIAMERLEGESLGQRLGRTHALPQRAVVPIALETLSALQAAHEARLVHRDLKPDNIFLAHAAGVGEVVKVLDFGIAKLLDGGAAAALTATGMVVGTPLYMSPEQAQGKTIDGRADLYSLGAVLFEALSGRTPFAADSYTALLLTIVTEPAPSLAACGVDVEPRLAAVVDRALSKDPGARFASAREMADALRALRLDTADRAAVATSAASSLALAETVQGAATPPVAPGPARSAEVAPVASDAAARSAAVAEVATVSAAPVVPAPTGTGRRPLVRLRWPRTTAVGTIIVAVIAVFSWVGLRQGGSLELSDTVSVTSSHAPQPPGMPIGLEPPLPIAPVAPPTTQVLPPTPITPSVAPGHAKSPATPRSPDPSRPPPEPEGPAGPARVAPSSFVSPDVPNVRLAFASRSDWSSCWPREVAPRLVNRGHCFEVSVTANGEVIRVRPQQAEPPGFLQCIRRHTRGLRFQPPRTGTDATFRACFTVEPARR